MKNKNRAPTGIGDAAKGGVELRNHQPSAKPMAKPSHYTTADIHQRDDGLWEIGLGENSLGPFPNREFALSVAGHVPRAPAIPFRRIKFKEARSAGTP